MGNPVNKANKIAYFISQVFNFNAISITVQVGAKACGMRGFSI